MVEQVFSKSTWNAYTTGSIGGAGLTMSLDTGTTGSVADGTYPMVFLNGMLQQQGDSDSSKDYLYYATGDSHSGAGKPHVVFSSAIDTDDIVQVRWNKGAS